MTDIPSALRDLAAGMSGSVVSETLHDYADEVERLQSRLAALDAWLEARGLPKDSPPKDWEKWGWVVDGFDSAGRRVWNGGRVVGIDEQEACREIRARGYKPHSPKRWDFVTQEQRAEAIRLEGARDDRP